MPLQKCRLASADGGFEDWFQPIRDDFGDHFISDVATAYRPIILKFAG